MARVIVGSYMFRYPLGGMMSWVLQYLLGLKHLGHDVFFVEKHGYDNACFDPQKGIMSDDCSYGIKTVSALLKSIGLGDNWCFVEKGNRYYGISERKINEIFAGADLFVDMGTHGSWREESQRTARCVWVDGEPGYTQIKLYNQQLDGKSIPTFDHYFSNGLNIGMPGNPIPTLGIEWIPLFHPVDTSLFIPLPSYSKSPYTTIMNWQSHQQISYNGQEYGQKDIEFQKFKMLPLKVDSKLEVAVSGREVPFEELRSCGWQTKSGWEVTRSFESFREYIRRSRGEFSVCKNVFVAMQSGWFSDKSAAFLAAGRPVILQDTGFSLHIPTGLGLFAVKNTDEAAAALDAIETSYAIHSRAARELAAANFESTGVMRRFMDHCGGPVESNIIDKEVINDTYDHHRI